MAGTQVGSLYTSLTLESSSFISNAKRTATATEQMAASIDKSFGLAKGAVVGFIASLSVGAFTSAIKGALDYADAVTDLADRTGASTKAIQEFRFAAQLSGSSTEDADRALEKFTKTLGAAQKGTGAQADLFKRLGVETKNADGSYRSLDEVLRSFADGIDRLPTVQQQNAATLEAMGKSAGTLTTLLSGGADGFNSLADEAARYGIVLDEQLLRASGPVNDQLDRMKMIMDAQFSGAVAQNADSIMSLAKAIGSLAVNLGAGIKSITDFVGKADRLKRVIETGDLDGLRNFAANERANSLNDLFPLSAGQAGTRRTAAPIFDTEASATKTTATKAAKAAQDAYKGFSAAQVRGGAMDTLADVLGTNNAVSQGLQDATQNALDYSAALRDVGAASVAVPDIGPLLISAEAVETANQFADNLSRGLGQAIIFGQSLGDALVNSIKAAAAELITSGLLDLLKGGKDGGGGLLGGIIKTAGAIFGGGKAGGGSVKAGFMYDVGELGRERFVAPADGQIIPADVLKRGGNSQRTAVDVNVNASPLLVATVVTAATQSAQASASEQQRQASRPRLAGGLG